MKIQSNLENTSFTYEDMQVSPMKIPSLNQANIWETKQIKYLRARIDTCAEANILQLSVYKLIFKDPNYVQLAPSSKLKLSYIRVYAILE